MAEEGLDIANLNVVILSTPKGATKQSIGRILRKDVYETHPIVIDIEDEDNSIFVAQSKKRNAYYAKQHYQIQNFRVSDYELKNYHLYNDKKFIEECIIKTPDNKKKYVPPTITPYATFDLNNIDFVDDE